MGSTVWAPSSSQITPLTSYSHISPICSMYSIFIYLHSVDFYYHTWILWVIVVEKKKHAPQDVFPVVIFRTKKRNNDKKNINKPTAQINVLISTSTYNFTNLTNFTIENPALRITASMLKEFSSCFVAFSLFTKRRPHQVGDWLPISMDRSMHGWGGKARLSMLMMYIPWTLQWFRVNEPV